jgi:hypothetical protein
VRSGQGGPSASSGAWPGIDGRSGHAATTLVDVQRAILVEMGNMFGHGKKAGKVA